MRFVLPVIGALAGCSFEAPIGGVPTDGRSNDTPPDVETTSRVTDGLVGLWRFDEGAGSIVSDTTRSVNPAFAKEPMLLSISQPTSVEWVPGGLRINDRVAISSPASPQAHLCRDIIASDAMTIEMWATPADTTQGTGDYAVLFTLSPSAVYRNASLAQVGDHFMARVLTTSTAPTLGATPELVSTAGSAATAPVHVVLVADATQRVLYVNGEPAVSQPDGVGSFANWKDNYRITIGDEVGSDHHWEGTLWFAAAYDRALTAAEVRENLAAGFDCAGC